MLVAFAVVVLIFTIPCISTSLVVETRLRFPPDVIVLFETLSIVIVPLLLMSNEPHVISCSPNDDRVIPLALDVIVIGSSVSIVIEPVALMSNTPQLISVSAAPEPRVSCPTLVMPIVDVESAVIAPVALISNAALFI